MSDKKPYQRLSVNINEESAEILRHVTEADGITTTEAIRRAIGLLGYFGPSSEIVKGLDNQ
jgi:hypothetical protein